MEVDQNESEQVRELRLEGPSLLVVGGLLVAVMAGSFFVGRWYERRTSPASPELLGATNSLGHVVTAEQQEAVNVDDSADFFDTVGDGSAEPSREGARAGSQPEGAPGGGPTMIRGEYYVQVFAGRDESAAASLVSKLEAEGQPVGVHMDRQGGDSLYKVRVGGYATQDAAREAARALQEQGYAGAWVTKAD